MAIYKDEKRNTWYVNTSYIDQYGVRRYKTKRNFKRRKDAKKWEENFHDLIKGGETFDVLPFDTLADHYLSYYTEKNKPSSANSLKSHLKVNLRPFFKEMNVHKMAPQDVLDFQKYMINKDLSTSYIIKAQSHLTGMLSHGIRFFALKINASSLAGYIKDSDKVIHNVWTVEQFEHFYDLIDDIEHQAMFRLLFYSGLRKGEARALTWKDVNFEQSYINVDKTNYKGKVHEPKSKSSIRIVYMPAHTMDILKEYQSWYKENKPYKSGYVVFGSFYKAVGETTIDRWYDRYHKLSGLPKIKIHEFRHSHITDCIFRANMSKDLVMKRVGHSNLDYIEEIYANPYSDTQKSAADLL